MFDHARTKVAAHVLQLLILMGLALIFGAPQVRAQDTVSTVLNVAVEGYSAPLITVAYDLTVTNPPNPYRYRLSTLHAERMSDVAFTFTGGTCEQLENRDIRCDGGTTQLNIKLRYRWQTVEREELIGFPLNANSDVPQELAVKVIYPAATMTYVSATIPPQTAEAGSLSWVASGSTAFANALVFRIGAAPEPSPNRVYLPIVALPGVARPSVNVLFSDAVDAGNQPVSPRTSFSNIKKLYFRVAVANAAGKRVRITSSISGSPQLTLRNEVATTASYIYDDLFQDCRGGVCGEIALPVLTAFVR